MNMFSGVMKLWIYFGDEGVRKIIISWVMMKLRIFFVLSITKLNHFGGHLCTFQLSFKVNVQNLNIFVGFLYFQIFFWGISDIPDIFFFLGGGVNSRCRVKAYVSREN